MLVVAQPPVAPFYESSPTLNLIDPISLQIAVPNGVWQLSFAPTSGWTYDNSKASASQITALRHASCDLNAQTAAVAVVFFLLAIVVSLSMYLGLKHNALFNNARCAQCLKLCAFVDVCLLLRA